MSVSDVQSGSIQAQLISQGATINASSNSAASSASETEQPSIFASSGAGPVPFTSRASGISATLKSGGNVGTTVASDFASWANAQGVPQTAASFGTFASQYGTGLQEAGLSTADASTAIGQGQAAIFSGQQVKNFTMGQSQA